MIQSISLGPPGGGGGRNATCLPGCNVIFDESFLFLGSLGPTELVLGGTVIETERGPPATGIGVLGDEPRGRLFLFSPPVVT